MAKRTIRNVKSELPQILQKWRWAELPPFEANAVKALAQEVIQLRERINILETQVLGSIIGLGHGGVGGPAELPASDAMRALRKKPQKTHELPH